ncbi:hypothetical protein [Paraliomyxa miuraensis]|uniref:hypothetical protein n=1 Tax=Paraliomyxa miuraensis TaxID=376150 RepID=UPI00224D7155|nr:hypothetical protein [Paraliomyxa miuraensis]MCX4246483.1 hypothetical protein [Paraliomyxa miuraensis]
MHDRSDAESEARRVLGGFAQEADRSRAMTEQGSGPADGPAEHEDELDHEELVAHGREVMERRIATITDAVNREAVDSGWAPAMERQLSEGLVARGPHGARLISAVCKTTLCIADVEHPPGDDGMGYVNWLTVFGMSRGYFVRHSPTSSTGARTMAYLARDGHSLPPVEPRSPARTR